jgi:hypothetical protein
MIAIFSGCGGSSESGPTLPTRTLSWEPPTTYVDGSVIDLERDLDRIEIYVNENGESFADDDHRADVSAVTTSFNLANIGSPLTEGPTYYVSLRAVARTGQKSDFSQPVPFSF